MAQVKVAVLVCDNCGNDSEVERWQIRYDGKASNVDLCQKQKCSGAIKYLITLGGEGRGKRKVVTPEDVRLRRGTKKTVAAKR